MLIVQCLSALTIWLIALLCVTHKDKLQSKPGVVKARIGSYFVQLDIELIGVLAVGQVRQPGSKSLRGVSGYLERMQKGHKASSSPNDIRPLFFSGHRDVNQASSDVELSAGVARIIATEKAKSDPGSCVF